MLGRYWHSLESGKSAVEVYGIKTEHLNDFKDCNIATKMSWAASRNTSVMEDEAYCLLGLFDVHMPLIYGEGRNAFLRLQKELITRHDDESVFAWTGQSSKFLGTY